MPKLYALEIHARKLKTTSVAEQLRSLAADPVVTGSKPKRRQNQINKNI